MYNDKGEPSFAWFDNATQYPSILELHKRNPKGELTEEFAVSFDEGEKVSISEKVDGFNVRILCMYVDGEPRWVVGGRTELLGASNSLVFSKSNDVVKDLHKLADMFCQRNAQSGKMVVLWGELYGGQKTPKWANYAAEPTPCFRAFDAAEFSEEECELLRSFTPQQAAGYRDNGRIPFVSSERLAVLCGCGPIPRVPFLREETFTPKSLRETLEHYSAMLPVTRAAMGVEGTPEGVVIRNADRTKIAKVRFAEYRKAIK
jgi:hypothetical protein